MSVLTLYVSPVGSYPFFEAPSGQRARKGFNIHIV